MHMLQCGKYQLPLDQPILMGVVNLTPDSFSGDGLKGDVERALAHAQFQLDSGADILDVGAESTRPGSAPTHLDEELARLRPVLRELVRWGVPISVDTYKAPVMREALAAGASMINDIAGMAQQASLDVVADSDCAVCVMHMQGIPGGMQEAPRYENVVVEVKNWLDAAVDRCIAAKITPNRIVIDPGFGFGKRLEHNVAMFRNLDSFCNRAYPLLVGVSRKTMLGEITGRVVAERKAASIAAAMLAAQRGAAIIRVHDVAETRDALNIMSALA